MTITSELIHTDVLLRLGFTATENGGVFRDLNVNGEVFSFVATPAIVHNAKKLAKIVSVGHDIDVGDVEGWIRDVERGKAVREDYLGAARRSEQCRRDRCLSSIGRGHEEVTKGLDSQEQRWSGWQPALRSSCRTRDAGRL